MPRVTCPRCAHQAKLQQYVVIATIRCPRCATCYQASGSGHVTPLPALLPASSGGSDEQEPEADQPSAPLLTAPHQCQHCGASMRSPAGRTRATVACPACDNPTSVYAVLHSCPGCRLLLESPSKTAGSETTCPACGRLLRVPRDVLLAKPPVAPDDCWFGFYCASCSEEVAAREKDVGTYAVCPHCRVPLDVPHYGHPLEGARPAPPRGPLDCLHSGKDVACPSCRTRFPARAGTCPVCGARPASPQ